MKNNTLIYKKFVSAFLASVYIFSVILVSFFHKHTTVFNLNSDSFTGSSSSNKIIFYGNEDSCFSIHNSQILIGDSHQLLEFKAYKPNLYKEVNDTQTASATQVIILFFSLRAPPFTI